MKLFDFFRRKNNQPLAIYAPVDGKLISLDKVEDEAFAQKMVGDGFAFEPKDGKFVSPINGDLVATYPTKHAYGIKNANGVELLLHVGLDTVKLKGEGFTPLAKPGQALKVGDALVDVDLEKIKDLVPSTKVPLVFLEQRGRKIEIVKSGEVSRGDLVAYLK